MPDEEFSDYGDSETYHNIIPHIRELKADVDIMILQLSTGTYVSQDTFINNWEHFVRMGGKH